MGHKTERRLVPFSEFEVRAGEGDTPPEMVGYAAIFNQETVIADWFDQWREQVAPGAFKKTLKEGDIRALFNHNPDIVLGRNKAGTLALKEDGHGLHTVIQPPDNEWGRPVLDAIRRGDVSGMSISFQVVKDEWVNPEKGSKDLALRTIREVRLMDVSPVTFPAYEQTEISARMAELRSALAKRAQMGLVLTAEDRQEIAEAVNILRGVTEEPEAKAHHSSLAADGEPEAQTPSAVETPQEARVDHSPEARARRLRLIQLTINSEEM